VTLGGALFLREPLGWRRFTAIVVGFLGVLLIVRPGTEGFTVYSVYALISVVFVTIRDLSTRRLSAEVPSLTVAISAAAGVTLFGAVGVAGAEWVPVSPRASLLLGGAALFIIGGYLFSVTVMRVGDIGAVAPFRYTSLLFALVLGFLLFGEWPTLLTLAGAAVVAGTGIYTLLRERYLGRRAVMPLRMR
jgi:S-adenosylmethionine uptake transporter